MNPARVLEPDPDPMSVLAVAQALIDELEKQLADTANKLSAAQRAVRRLERELEEVATVATVVHVFVRTWDGPGPEVVIDAGAPGRVDTLRSALRLMRQFCAEHPETERAQ